MTILHLGSRIAIFLASISSGQVLVLTLVCSLLVFFIEIGSKGLSTLNRPQYIPVTANTLSGSESDVCLQHKKHSGSSKCKRNGASIKAVVPIRTDYPARYGIRRLQVDGIEDDESLAIAMAEADTYKRAYCNAMWSPPFEIMACILVLSYLYAVTAKTLQEIAQLGLGLYVAFNTIIYYPTWWCAATLIVPAIKQMYTCSVYLLHFFTDLDLLINQ